MPFLAGAGEKISIHASLAGGDGEPVSYTAGVGGISIHASLAGGDGNDLGQYI